MITGTSMPTATVIMTGIMTTGKITTATAWDLNIIGGNVTAITTMATIAAGRFTTAIPRAIRADMAIPAVAMATHAQSTGAAATVVAAAAVPATVRVCRMGRTRPART